MIQFVDTFAFLAWLNALDQDHARVKRHFETFTGTFVTTEWVLVEFADALAAPACRGVAAQFLADLRKDEVFEVVAYESTFFDAGFSLYGSRPDKEWSLTDCISFAVMEARGLSEALTADHHFEQTGFRTVFKR